MSVRVFWGRNEYLGKKETIGAPRSPRAFASDRLLTDDRGSFSFDGHRLSSLYRGPGLPSAGLAQHYLSASFLQKNSNYSATGAQASEVDA